jgi:hypothetical protein
VAGRGNYWRVDFRAGDSFRDRQQASRQPASTVAPPPRPAAGQHPCARADYCSGSTATIGEDGKTIKAPALCYAAYCQKCRNQVYRALTAIPELWVRLHQELGSKGQASERVTMSRSAPLPLRADIDALLREHVDILASWDERVRMDAGLTMPDTDEQRRRPDHGRQAAAFCRTLAAHLDRLLELPPDAMSRAYSLHDLGKIPEGCHGRTNRIGGYAEVTVELSGADAGSEIMALQYRSRSVLGETRMVERLDVPCPDPSCDLLMLERVQGSDYSAECKACGRLLSDDEYRAWTRLYAATLSTAELDRARAAKLAAA